MRGTCCLTFRVRPSQIQRQLVAGCAAAERTSLAAQQLAEEEREAQEKTRSWIFDIHIRGMMRLPRSKMLSTQSSLEKRLVRQHFSDTIPTPEHLSKPNVNVMPHQGHRRNATCLSHALRTCWCAQELFNAYLERNRAFRRSLRESQQARERRTSEAISELAMLSESELGRYHDAICLRGATARGV